MSYAMTAMRRPALVLAALATVVAALVVRDAGARTTAAARECKPSVAGLNLQTATIPELQDALQAGKLTSKKLVGTYLTRIRAYDYKLNAIRALNPDALKIARKLDAERRAGKFRGLLHGIPVLLKDNVNTTNMPTTAGSQALKGSVPLHDATITKKLEKAGAIILGKVN